MPAAPTSPFEAQRLAAVHKLRLLGTPAEERFDKITRLARHMFDVPMACLDIVADKLVWLKSVQGFDGIEGLRKDSYCHYTVLDDGVCHVQDARTDARVFDSVLAEYWVFYAGAPLHFEGERVGVLCIGDSTPRDFDAEKMSSLTDLASLAERELQVAALSAAQVALAASHEELEMKARIDVLTHLWNRGAILDIANAECAAAQMDKPMAALMLDIDHFKAINDTHGHPAGDEVLRVVASRLRSAIRKSDAVGRYGGEEFLIILPDADLAAAAEISERIRQEVASSPISFGELTIPVTCSIGYSIVQNAVQDAISSLIGRADSALYRAKTSGRNRVEVGAPSGDAGNIADVVGV